MEKNLRAPIVDSGAKANPKTPETPPIFVVSLEEVTAPKY